MEMEMVFGAVVLSVLIILFIISKLNRAIRLLNNRVNIHSSLIKKLKKHEEPEESEQDEIIRSMIEKDFKA
ncbi:MAG: hypothetical protein A3I04_03655 [Nitrospinae bacterium RIFCSPLOWO2_02_FULL_39_110]|nr:MAG: hypothetical protein A2W53_07060 [Nitrospinae bacterium RIFCSPHIGHO2_02_39_11]OGV99622.1 MAG: hypothetical protein A3D97_02930 [Nitrospinae bacterium RIFCSPHIGHO2_12_FULL_39_42]OGW01166.1 MAG: hypothetical protein A3D20_01025 [Nitrospinae bacterium RIFCSPHIGHO2_02_FULL_39_82]OGW05303.1 MAG: hypothetical protein A3I04_03655 [Nitrospinae bacterium RIFCSPLOWO2_02_FULL_39_110]OGW05546.1 MAG: hypothetical protein A2Z59_01650 [Nitrospinae bacterium RIFCSPLOWO2_02_39_17]OGW10088.1 MAG: hypoth